MRSFDQLVARVSIRSTSARRCWAGVISLVALLAGSSGTAFAQVQLSLDAQLNLGALNTGASFSVELGGSDLINLSAQVANVSAALSAGQNVNLDLQLPNGMALTGVTCPDAVGVATSGSSVSLTSNGATGSSLSDCSFSIVDVAGATTAAVMPFVARQADLLLSVELGLDQQLDRFSDWGDEPFQTASVAAPAFADASGPSWESGARMGLSTSESSGAIAFSSSLQQARRASAAAQYAEPNKLGYGAARPPAASQTAFNVWTEGFWQHFDSDDRVGESDGHSGVLYAGADYLVSQRLLIGALVQYDDFERRYDSLPLQLDEKGWLVGPYAVVRLTDKIFFQGRAAWGRTDNGVSLDQAFDDDFNGDRWLVKGRLMASLRSGPWLLRPSASIAYVEEDLDAYRSSAGVDIAGRSLSLGQAKLGPELSYRYDAGGGLMFVPAVTVEGIWNFHQDFGGPNFDDLVSDTGVRGRVEAGMKIVDSGAMSVGASVIYDGIGDDDYSGIGGRARVTVPLN